MKHYIVVKFIDGFDYCGRLGEIKAIFKRTLEIDGIYSLDIKTSNSDRENRYDLMIEMDMEKSALESYDISAPHKEWKDIFGEFVEKKAIFDCD